MHNMSSLRAAPVAIVTGLISAVEGLKMMERDPGY